MTDGAPGRTNAAPASAGASGPTGIARSDTLPPGGIPAASGCKACACCPAPQNGQKRTIACSVSPQAGQGVRPPI